MDAPCLYDDVPVRGAEHDIEKKQIEKSVKIGCVFLGKSVILQFKILEKV